MMRTQCNYVRNLNKTLVTFWTIVV